MKKEISVRDYRPEDVQALANIYFNTIHQINTQHYTKEQVDVWAPTSSLETEGWAKKFPKRSQLSPLSKMKSLDLLNSSQLAISIAFIVTTNGLGKALDQLL